MQKPLRIERQKGKAALGKLKLIEDLPKERCCVDNCVMVSFCLGSLSCVSRDLINCDDLTSLQI